MKTHVFPLDFVGGRGPILTPRDPELFELVKKYCRENLAAMPDFTEYSKMWVSARLKSDGSIDRITGISGYNMKPDIPLFRTEEAAAAQSLYTRMNAFFSDQGIRGGEVFIYIAENEPEESRCPKWKFWLKAFKAKPAERYKVIAK